MYFANDNAKKTEPEPIENYGLFKKGPEFCDFSNNVVTKLSGGKWSGKREVAARERWKLLAKALSASARPTKTSHLNNISVRRFASFGLIEPNNLEKTLDKLGNSWIQYVAALGERKLTVDVRLLQQHPTATELMGFNNTGNVCVWPSEEVLAWYLLPRAALFAGKSVVELGGGMTCLAGILLAKYSQARKIHLTDGNALSVENVCQIVERNALQRTVVSLLNWSDYNSVNCEYDVALSADCLFFDETRWQLVETLWHCLTPRGVALVMAPARGGTLHAFLQCARARGFICTVHARYCDSVWARHLHFRQTCSEYDEDLHYPLLLLLTKDQ